MKRMIISILALAVGLVGCGQKEKQVKKPETQENPFFSEYKTPLGSIPFDTIKAEHYLPAFEKAVAEQNAEIKAIVDNTEAPGFANTIEAMEKSGALVRKVSNAFFTVTGANTNAAIQETEKKVSPMLAKLTDDIYLNADLFKRVKAVYDARADLTLRPDQVTLLEKTYKGFIRGGANLNAADQQTLRDLNERLTNLSLDFKENLLNETNDFEMVIDQIEDLEGLPQGVIDAAAATAEKRGHAGKWVFTTHNPSITPFLTYARNRDLREKIFKGYIQRGDNDNANDNKKIASEMASIRAQRAQLMGYPTHAHFVLEDYTAKTPENVYGLLDQVWPAALARAKQEVEDMQKIIDAEGGQFKLEPWDWWYYADKVRSERYAFDEELTRPYFSVNATVQGAFYVAKRLFGIEFKERFDVPVYHPDVRVFDVTEADGKVIGLYMIDTYVRESKRGGAWMNAMRKQQRMNGEDVLPIIYNVFNFPEPVGDELVLLTFDQSSTVFHEFGHAIHGLLSDGVYVSQTGTALPRDYVEFPSQVMEYWMTQPEVLGYFAKHYKTGEIIPQELVEKIQAASKFNQGFATVEYLAASYLDLNWHTLKTTELQDADSFEAEAMNKLGLIKEIVPRYRTGYFAHIFSGGYSSGYYGYIWSDVLSADSFDYFKTKGIFDPETAAAFRKHVLSAGGMEDPMTQYRRFRGKDPEIKPLLVSKGLIEN